MKRLFWRTLCVVCILLFTVGNHEVFLMNQEHKQYSDKIFINQPLYVRSHFDLYIVYIKSHYEKLNVDVDSIHLFEYITPKGFNQQTLVMRYKIHVGEDIVYGVLEISITSIISFVYELSERHKAIISFIATAGFLYLAIRIIKKH